MADSDFGFPFYESKGDFEQGRSPMLAGSALGRILCARTLEKPSMNLVTSVPPPEEMSHFDLLSIILAMVRAGGWYNLSSPRTLSLQGKWIEA